MSTNIDGSGVVKLPIPKITQSLNISDEDIHKTKREDSKPKSKKHKHKHIDLYFDKSFLDNYFNV